MNYDFPPISADPHVTEPDSTYVDYIDPKWRDEAPRIVRDAEFGDLFVVPGMKPIKLGLLAAAGQKPEEMKAGGLFEEMHRSGWDPSFRVADQVRDGVSAEVLYPTVGMLICNHPDFEFKSACFRAYNRWLAEYCAEDPHRLIGVGQTGAHTVEESINDLHDIKAAGIRGVMLPGNPAVGDYCDPEWDPFWAEAVLLGLPMSFHILTTGATRPRGSNLNRFMNLYRGIQDIVGMLVLGAVFDRHPDMRVVCVEADAGWIPHYTYRLDHAYSRHRHHLTPGETLQLAPSEYFARNIYATFQDDWTAFEFADAMNWRRLMWANDFPHSDSTWPWSRDLLDKQSSHLTTEQLQGILSQNCADLYDIDLSTLVPVSTSYSGSISTSLFEKDNS